jgi:hypothetical protein
MPQRYAPRLQIGALLLGFASLSGPAWPATVTIIFDTRSLSFEPNSFCQFNCPPPMTASGPIVNGTFALQFGDGSYPGGLANQNTTVSADGSSMVGSGSSLSWENQPGFNNGGGASHFELFFTLAQAMDFTFTGTAAGGGSEVAFFDIDFSTGVRYEAAGTGTPNTVSGSGTLTAGHEFALRGDAATEAGTVSTPGGHVPLLSSFSFDLSLSPASTPLVPLPPAAWLLLSGLGALLGYHLLLRAALSRNVVL